ncbi:MAG: alpha/beta fold hydrolase, partial [Beijerinckiaceae bacterium]|nr:alpha/beta fold hydrolase [Beijerinckiaceae bacterium]
DKWLLPVVCLHGLTRNARDFEDLAPIIAKSGRRVLVAEMRGRGSSAYDPDPANYHFLTYAADVAALLDSLGIARAIFIGTSMGGFITMFLASERSDLVAAAVLNDIGPEIAPEGLARIGQYVGKSAPIASWQDAADYARMTSGSALPDYGDADWLRFARRMFREDGTGIPVLDYDIGITGGKSPPTGTPEENWAKFEAMANSRPTMVLRGAISDILSLDTVSRMSAKAPTLIVESVAGVGHAPVLDEPAALAAITDFLSTLD